MVAKMAFLHKNCNNFRDGLCMLYGVAVDLSGVACPSFMAKRIVAPQVAKTYPRVQQLHQQSPLMHLSQFPLWYARARNYRRPRGRHRGGREFRWH